MVRPASHPWSAVMGEHYGAERNGSIRDGQAHMLRRSREVDMIGTEQQLGTTERGRQAQTGLSAGSFVIGAVLYAVLESMPGPRAQRAPQAPAVTEIPCS
jgi:hypothetical protein